MLSKLFAALQHTQGMNSLEQERIWDSFSKRLTEKYSSVVHLKMGVQRGGTLGILSFWKINGKDIVAKTHLPGERYRRNIEKEYSILHSLYAEDLFIDKEIVKRGFNTFSVLLVEKLVPLERVVRPDEVLALLESVHQVSSPWTACNYSTEDILVYQEHALEILTNAGLLDLQLEAYLRDMGPELKRIFAGPLVWAHGDLSNPNILSKGKKLYLLDWEDAFLCTPDYDFLYWMTFLSQQEFCNKKNFEKFGICNRRSEILLLTIVLLKSYIAFLTGAYKQHKVSIHDRLQTLREIFV